MVPSHQYAPSYKAATMVAELQNCHYGCRITKLPLWTAELQNCHSSPNGDVEIVLKWIK